MGKTVLSQIGEAGLSVAKKRKEDCILNVKNEMCVNVSKGIEWLVVIEGIERR